jgi:SPP1 family predicted phage head-tail adaptor
MSLPAAGELNRRIVIKAQADIPAMGAAITQNFTTLATVWAKHQPVGAAVFFGTKQVGENVTDRFIVRRNSTVNEQKVTGDHVIDFAGSRYRVKRASDLEGARQYTMIEAECLGNV